MKRRDFIALAAALPLAKRVAAQDRADRTLALVLGGGGCRGYGHIGVLRALERHDLKPDMVVGSSAGSLVGALYAAGLPVATIERLGARLSANTLRDWVFPRLGVFGGDGIARFVRAQVGERSIESLPMRFAAVATDLRSGEAVTLDRGELGLAVQASSSAPGLLEPVRLNGRLLVDGNLAAPVPVRAARRLGAKRVIAVDVSFPPAHADLGDPFDALYQGFSILTRRLALEERAQAEVVIAPDLPKHDDMKPATLQALIDAGEAAAEAALPAIRRLVAAGSR
ncbi:MAG: patatin-like phospholipase family protein [Burkholderiales bacterium]